MPLKAGGLILAIAAVVWFFWMSYNWLRPKKDKEKDNPKND